MQNSQCGNNSNSIEDSRITSDEDVSMFFETDPFEECSSSKKLKVAETVKGASLYEIYQGNNPWCAPEFPVILPSHNHTVLYHIPEHQSPMREPPIPYQGYDKWDKDHVRMPCSSQSLYPVQDKNGKSVLKNRWEMIKDALTQPISNSKDLQTAILKYNSKFSKQWKFNALHRLFNDYLEEEETDYFFKMTLPEMVKLALRLPELIPSAIPLLKQNQNRSISMSQQQVACLLANAFFCTFPRRNSNKPNAEYCDYPNINFCRLFQQGGSDSVLEKLKCICNYFRRVCRNVPCGVLTFTRRSIERSKMPNWKLSNKYIGSVPLCVDSKGTIEDDGIGLLQVDFANKFLGGGVLNYGCVQEEIRFVICPELLLSMLFTEVMKSGEALLMIGAERYNDYTGYSDSFQWSGNHDDKTEYDSSNRRRCAIVAIDALFFHNPRHQYKPELIDRELNKAWVGYSIYSKCNPGELSLPGIATGNWGCGAFRGSPHLKSLLQLMACCECQRPIVYYTFNDVHLQDEIVKMYNFLRTNNVTVGQLYKYLCLYHTKHNSDDQLYPFILQQHNNKENSKLLFKQSIVKKPEELSQKQSSSSSKADLDASQITDILETSSSDKVSTSNNLQEGSKEIKTNESAHNASFFDAISEFSNKSSSSKVNQSVLSYFDVDKEKQNLTDSEMTSSEDINTKSSDSSLLSKFSAGKITSYFQRVKKD